MKVAKKVIGIAIAALLTVVFCWSAVNGALIVFKGRIDILTILYFLPPVIVAVVGFFKALFLLLRSFKTSEDNYAYRKDCVRMLKTVISYFVLTALCNLIGSFFSTALSAANSSSGPSNGMLQKFVSNLGLTIFMVILAVLGLIFISIGVGKRADDKPVRKIPVLIGVAFLWGCVGINNSFTGIGAVTSFMGWLYIISAVLVVVLTFMKPETLKAAEAKEEVATTEEVKAEETKTEE